MHNVKLTIEYDGTNYCGWQTQSCNKDKISIQKIIENALEKILQEEIKIISSGRTDAGVHAFGQIANFKTRRKIALKKIHRSLQSLLPNDIVISKIERVNLNFHSRFAVKTKTYRYTILSRSYPSAFLRNEVCFYPHPLDSNLMRQEALCLEGRHDFRAFCASDSSARNTLRTIKRVTIKKLYYDIRHTTYDLNKGHLINVDIEADGFLYNMVRNIVGTLIEIGRGRFPKGSLKRILLSKDRRLAGPTAPAKGLCLLKVKY